MSVSGNGNGSEPVGRLQALERENAQLRQALGARIVIEQAKGVLAERFRLDLVQAFELLRRAARSNRLSIHTLAESVATGVATPPEIEEVLYQLARPESSAAGPGRRVDLAS